MIAGWDLNDWEYSRLNVSVEAAGGGGSGAAQQRWARARQQVTGSLRVVRAMLDQSFEDFAAQAAAQHLLMDGQPKTTSARTSLSTEGGSPWGGLFMPESNSSSNAYGGGPPSSGTILLPIGSGNHQLLLVDPLGQSPNRVAIEAKDRFISGVARLAPCGRCVCTTVGLANRSRLVMYRIDRETPWPTL